MLQAFCLADVSSLITAKKLTEIQISQSWNLQQSKYLCSIIPHFSFCWSLSLLKDNRIIASLTLFLISFTFRCSLRNIRLESMRNKCYCRCSFDCLHLISHGIKSSIKASLLASEVIKFYYGKNLNRRQNPNNFPWRELF